MVDHIHFPKSVAPLYPTERIKKVKRRKDRQQESGFKENLEKEKKNSEDSDEDTYEPDQNRNQIADAGASNQIGKARASASSKKKKSGEDPVSKRKIDVHA